MSQPNDTTPDGNEPLPQSDARPAERAAVPLLQGQATADAPEVGATGSLAERAPAPVAGQLRRDDPPAPAPKVVRIETEYVLEEEVGRGGMGEVIAGRDLALNRPVAVKVLKGEHAEQEKLVRRFVEEAQVASQLQHPGVPPVHVLGKLPDGRPCFAMKLVKGQTLAALLKDRPSPAHELARFLTVFEQVCQAVAYAHSKRVIHRDLKPPNVMVGAFGEVQVMDWGMAKVLPEGAAAESEEEPAASVIATDRMHDPDSHTRAGSMLGTPAYMPPEQARGELERVDRRSDVFGLGAILCEVLTGKPPYGGENVIVKAQRGLLVPALERLEACGADSELVSLTKECLSAAPEGRPADAGAVARAVAAYQAGVQERLRRAERERAAEEARAEEAKVTAAATARAEEAKATAAAERRARWLALGLAAASVLGVVATGYFLIEAVNQGELARQEAGEAAAARKTAERLAGKEAEARKQAEEAGKNAEGARQLAERLTGKEAEARKEAEVQKQRAEKEWGRAEGLVYAGQLALAQGAWDAHDARLAWHYLDSTRGDYRHWEYRYLHTLFNHLGQRTFQGHTGFVTSVAFSPDGKRILSGSTDKTVKVWDAATGQEALTLRGHTGVVYSVAFSPDGKRIASAGGDGTLKVWDAAAGQEALTLKGHTGFVHSVAFSPDGKRLASGSTDKTVKVWDAATGQEALTLRGHTGFVYGVAFSPNGKRLASGSTDNTLKVWDAATGQEALTLKGHTGVVRSVAFSPDGKRIASAGWDGTVRVWDAGPAK